MGIIKISIIVPVYNVKEYLEECIESVLKQTYTDFELILVDDGSTDGSGEICDRYQTEDSRVVVIHQNNMGVCAARNAGIEKSSGEYIIFLDSDDIIAEDLVYRAVYETEKRNLDCFVYGYQTFGDNEEEFLNNERTDRVLYYNDADAIEIILKGYPFRMLACNKLYKKELWDDIRFPINRKYGDDTTVTYKIIGKCKKIGYTRDIYYYYRQRGNSALHLPVSVDNLQLFDAYDELLMYVEKNYPQLCLLSYRAYVDRIFDFFVKLNNSNDNKQQKNILLEGLIEHIRKQFKKIIKSATLKQKIIVYSLYFSPGLFWIVYKLLI